MEKINVNTPLGAMIGYELTVLAGGSQVRGILVGVDGEEIRLLVQNRVKVLPRHEVKLYEFGPSDISDKEFVKQFTDKRKAYEDYSAKRAALDAEFGGKL